MDRGRDHCEQIAPASRVCAPCFHTAVDEWFRSRWLFAVWATANTCVALSLEHGAACCWPTMARISGSAAAAAALAVLSDDVLRYKQLVAAGIRRQHVAEL